LSTHTLRPPAGQFITPYIQLLESFPYQLKKTRRQVLYFLREAARSRFWHSSRFALARLWVPSCSRRGQGRKGRGGRQVRIRAASQSHASSWASLRMSLGHRPSEARDVARGAAQSAPVEPCCTLLNPVAPDRTRPASGKVCVLDSASACAPYQ